MDLDGLSYYSNCYFGSYFCSRLLSQQKAKYVNYNIHINLTNLDLIKPGAIYYFYFEADTECHHFTLIYNNCDKAIGIFPHMPVFQPFTVLNMGKTL